MAALSVCGERGAVDGDVAKRDGAVLVLDLRGFSALSERLDHEAVYDFVVNLMHALSEAVLLLGGEVERFEGDLLIAFFPACRFPDSYSPRAVISGFKMQEVVQAANQNLQRWPISVGARVGIDCGCVQGGLEDGSEQVLLGEVVDRASWLESRAPVGGLLVSEAVRARCGGAFDWEPELGVGILSGEGAAYRCVGFHADSLHRSVPELRSYDADCDARVLPYLQSLGALQEQAGAQLPPTIEGGRRTVTVLFVHAEGLDPVVEDTRVRTGVRLKREVFRVVSAVIEELGGYVDKLESNQVMAVFGAMGNTDNHCQKAVVCALRIKELCGVVNEALAKHQRRLRVSSGVNLGPVTLAPDALGHLTVTGDAVNVAARMASCAALDTIQVTEAVRSFCGEEFRWFDLGRLQVKGKQEPLHCFCVEEINAGLFGRPRRRVSSAGAHSLTRAREVAELVDLWRGCFGAGAGAVCFPVLVAEEGMGKSFVGEGLVQELLGEEASLRVVRGGTAPYAQSPFWLWISLLRDSMGLVAGDPRGPEVFSRYYASLREDVGAGALREALEHAEPFLRDLLSIAETSPLDGMDADGIHNAVFNAVSTFLRALMAASGPRVFIVEDLHWIDPSSRALLLALVNTSTMESPLFVLGMCRSEDEFASIGEQLDESVMHRVLRLAPLGREDCRVVAKRLLAEAHAGKEASLSDEVTECLWSHAGGNPLYLQELLQDLLERNLVTLHQGEWTLAGEEVQELLPGSLSELIVSRMGRLSRSLRRSLEQCAVIGDSFTLEHVEFINRRLCRTVPTEAQLEQLVQCGFLQPQGAQGRVIFGFRHILVRNAVYHTILHRNRRVLHRCVAEYIELGDAAVVDEGVGLVAHHWHLAGHTEKTLHWGLKVIELRKRRYQVRDGLAWIETLHGLLESGVEEGATSERWLGLTLDKEYFLSLAGNFEERGSLLDTLLRCCEEESLKHYKPQVLQRYAILRQHQGELTGATAFYSEAYHRFMEQNDTAGAGLCLCNLGYLLCERGHPSEGEAYLKVARKLCFEKGHRVIEGHCLGLLGNSHYETGEYSLARESYVKALELFREEGEMRWQGVALGYLAHLERLRGAEGATPALKLLEEACELHRKVDDREYLAYDLCRMAGLRIDRAQWELARRHLHDARGILDFGSYPKVDLVLLSVRARLAFFTNVPGERDEGVSLLEKARSLIDAMGLTSTNERLYDFLLASRMGEAEDPSS
jgi:adenylate cyclase